MMQKIKQLVQKHWDILSYLFFGGLTTAVNYCVYFPMAHILDGVIPLASATVSNVIAWVAAVAFAYLTNKPFVFKSHDWSWKVVGPELAKFIGCRVGSGLLETGMIFLLVDIFQLDGNVIKLILSVLVVILNYVGSKLLVFTKKKTAE